MAALADDVFHKSTFDKISPDKRDKILNVAMHEFASCGFENANINTIAKKAGVSVGSLYKYFDTKSDLFLTCMNYGIETLETSIKKETESIVIKLAKERGYSIVFHKYRTNVAADDVTGDVISGLKKLGARAEAAEALNKKTAGSSTGK